MHAKIDLQFQTIRINSYGMSNYLANNLDQ